MTHHHSPAGRNALWLAGLAALNLLGAGATFAAEVLPAPAPAATAALIFDQSALDTPPALVDRAAPRSPPAHQPLFGAQLSFEFVVDPQGLTGSVKLLEAKATLSETGKILQESDLPLLRKTGLLDGIPANASFPEIRDLLTKPFIEPGKDAVLRWRYRPGRKAGVAVATRLTDSVVFQADELRRPENLPRTQSSRAPQATRPVQPSSPSATIEPVRPVLPVQPDTPPPPLGPSRAATAAVAISGSASTITTPGQAPTTVVRTFGRDSIITPPGEPPSTVVATPGGGSTIYTPGQAPTMIVPISGGGSIIYAPGQAPVIVMPNP